MPNREVSVSIKQDTTTREDYDALLSRLMDGDLDEFSVNRLLKRMDEQPSLRSTWHRYHVNRELLLGSETTVSSLNVADRVREELQQAGVRPQRRQHWIKTLRPFAVAASVACVGVLVGLQVQQTANPQTGSAIASSAVPTVRSMPVMPLDSAGLQAIPASFGQTQIMRAPAPVPVEGLYQELARQRLELYSNQHATAGALHSPVTLMTGTLARAEAEAGKR
jgi:sigma-E factor negative regulatory protein RseA